VTIVGKQTIRVAKHRNYFQLHRGEIFRYEIALKNTSKHPFRFELCPTYFEELVLPPSSRLAYTLNCHPVGTIAPGATARFAMEYRVPEHARLGYGGFIWELAPNTSSPPTAFAGVIVANRD